MSVGEVAVQSMSCNPALGTLATKSEDELTSNLNLVGGISVPLPGNVSLAKAGELRQTGYATAEPDRADAFERSVVQSVNLLDGRIKADVVQSDAWTTHDAAGYHHHNLALQDPSVLLPNKYGETPGPATDPNNAWNPRTGATFVNLVIDPDGPAGPQAPQTYTNTQDPNKVISLGSAGYVVLNEMKMTGTKYPTPTDPRYPNGVYSFSGVDVNAIHVYIADDVATPQKESFNGYNGEVIVAHSETRVQPAPGRLSGFAYGSRATVDPLLTSGPQAIIGLPCGGTHGADRNRTQGATSVTVPSNSAGITKALTTGTMSSTVNGVVDPTQPYSRSVEDIQQVRLFLDSGGGSRISADAIHSVARTAGTSASIVSSGDGTSFVNLVLDQDGSGPQAPQPISGTPPPNTKIPLDRLGYVILNEQNCSDSPDPTKSLNRCTSLRESPAANTHYNGLTTYGLHVVITVTDNAAGLPVGAEFFIGVAHSDVAF